MLNKDPLKPTTSASTVAHQYQTHIKDFTRSIIRHSNEPTRDYSNNLEEPKQLDALIIYYPADE